MAPPKEAKPKGWKQQEQEEASTRLGTLDLAPPAPEGLAVPSPRPVEVQLMPKRANPVFYPQHIVPSGLGGTGAAVSMVVGEGLAPPAPQVPMSRDDCSGVRSCPSVPPHRGTVRWTGSP